MFRKSAAPKDKEDSVAAAAASSATCPPPSDVATWTTTHVATWLNGINGGAMSRYADLFAEVNGAKLMALDTSEALKQLGITSVGHRTVLRKNVAELKGSTQG